MKHRSGSGSGPASGSCGLARSRRESIHVNTPKSLFNIISTSTDFTGHQLKPVHGPFPTHFGDLAGKVLVPSEITHAVVFGDPHSPCWQQCLRSQDRNPSGAEVAAHDGAGLPVVGIPVLGKVTDPQLEIPQPGRLLRYCSGAAAAKKRGGKSGC